MKIIGKVNIHDEPEVPLTLFCRGKKVRKKAVIDTGFNGYLSVPHNFAKGWYFSGYEEYELATGDIVNQEVYLGQILWNGKIQPVHVVTSKADDMLIGTKLLQKNNLLIRFPERKVVIS